MCVDIVRETQEHTHFFPSTDEKITSKESIPINWKHRNGNISTSVFAQKMPNLGFSRLNYFIQTCVHANVWKFFVTFKRYS